MNVTIEPGGVVRFIYDDRLQPLLELGRPEVRRMSRVEPTGDGRWTADLSPADGPTLGPFRLRSEALAAEVAWLLERGY